VTANDFNVPEEDHPDSTDDVLRLLSAQTDGSLDEAGRQRLTELLTSDLAARQAVRQYAALTAALRRQARRDEAGKKQEPALTLASPRRSYVAWLTRLGSDFLREPVALAVLVLVMISGGVLFWNLSQLSRPRPVVQQPPPGEPSAPGEPGASASRGDKTQDQHPIANENQQGADAPRSPVVARLTRSAGATWAQQDVPVEGTDLKAGQELSLEQGVAEITFTTGVKVILEGPAEFELGTQSKIENPKSKIANSCSLTLGKLFASVPTQAHGFTVQTPTLQIVDLGTEFGVQVRTESDPIVGGSAVPTTEVVVVQGEVQILRAEVAIAQAPPDTRPQVLKPGQSVISRPNEEVRPAQVDPAKFVREVPAVEKPFAAWPADNPLRPGDIVAVCLGEQRLVKIDPRTGMQTLLASGKGEFPGSHWRCVAVEPTGSVLISTGGLPTSGSALLRVDPRDGKITVLTTLVKRGPQEPPTNDFLTGIATSRDGQILGLRQSHPQPVLVRIDPVSGKISTVAPIGGNAYGICFDTNGQDTFLTWYETLALQHAATVTPWVTGEKLAFPTGVAVAPDGRVFVAVRQNDARRVLQIGRGPDHEVSTLVTLPEGLSAPELGHLAMERDGSLIAGSNSEAGEVFRIRPNKKSIEVLASGGLLHVPAGVAIVPGAEKQP
jgi:streptogramin lyase/ferric-dicitrate binding protein FerR (iron transport regulator)